MLIRPATLDEIIGLRHRILRAGLPREAADFPGDRDSDTRHFAAIAEQDRVVGCLSMMLNAWQDEPAWQLRGMAVDEALQRAGIGRQLLRACEEHARQDGRTMLLWCNARVPAVPFYLRNGWTIASDEFDIPTAGPHRKMMRRL